MWQASQQAVEYYFTRTMTLSVKNFWIILRQSVENLVKGKWI